MSKLDKLPEGVLKRTQLLHLDPASIFEVEGRNPRTIYTEIDELAESIKLNGVMRPITVQNRNGRWELMDGHRRLRAVMKVVKEGTALLVPAIRVDDSLEEKDVLLSMMTSNTGKPFAPFEEAALYKRLKDEFGLTVKDIAIHIGKSASHVSDKLALLNADISVQQAVQEGEMKASDANTIIRKSRGDKDLQKQLTEAAKATNVKAVTTELTKGRLNELQWNIAIKVVEDFVPSYISATDPELKKLFNAENFEELVLNDPNWTFLYKLGQLSAIASLGNFENNNHLISKANEKAEKLDKKAAKLILSQNDKIH